MTLNEFIIANPRASIILLGCIVTFISTLVTKWLTDQEHMRALKERQKEIQKDLKKNKDNPKLIEELQMEILKITGTLMKSQFKPLLVTIVPFLILFYWIRATFSPIMGFSWFWYYLVSSIISSIFLRKWLKVA